LVVQPIAEMANAVTAFLIDRINAPASKQIPPRERIFVPKFITAEAPPHRRPEARRPQPASMVPSQIVIVARRGALRHFVTIVSRSALIRALYAREADELEPWACVCR